MIPTITFASCYVYSPTGAGGVCERSRLLCALLKAGDGNFIHKYASRVRQQTEHAALLASFFHADDILLPVPGRAPHVDGNIWPAQRLAFALVNEGLGSSAWLGLRRARAVPKSATAVAGARPTVALHYESFRIERSPKPVDSVVLIDDVVTKGRTLLAAASRVSEAYPDAKVRAFALLRTMGLTSGIEHLLEPCQGQIKWKSGDAYRTP